MLLLLLLFFVAVAVVVVAGEDGGGGGDGATWRAPSRMSGLRHAGRAWSFACLKSGSNE